MLFNSYIFIFAFLPIVLGVHVLARRARNASWPVGWLVCASLFYYGWWSPKFLLLLLASMAVNYGFGTILLGASVSRSRARLVLVAGLAFNVGVLAYFKYAGFLVANANALLGAQWAIPNVLLPIGISFITFQKIAFLVDAYHGQVRNFTPGNFALFVTFFPQLIAGPIVHHSEIMPQLDRAWKRDFTADFAVGACIFIVGLCKKVLIADSLALHADAGFDKLKADEPLDTASAWVAILSYSFQLYYDFSGYSDMAVGLARMFGVRLPINFYSPYQAVSIIEFWRRWHMTLSRFLRDYLYVPLGGNRHGSVRRYANLMVVMLIGGLWHGANWTFVVWGGIHGLLLMINHAWRLLPVARHPLAGSFVVRTVFILTTFMLVTFAWVPFRADSLSHASAMFGHLFPDAAAPNGWGSFAKFFKLKPVGFLLIAVLAATLLMPNTYQIFRRFDPALGVPDDGTRTRMEFRFTRSLAVVGAAMFVLGVLGLSRVSPFLYFRF